MKICLTNEAKKAITDVVEIALIIIISLLIVITIIEPLLYYFEQDGRYPYWFADIGHGIWTFIQFSFVVWLYYWLKKSIYIKDCK